jgi:hypothetical protein
MPGTLIKEYTSQPDWQSGTLENLDATSVPGSLVPTGDFTRTFDSQADFAAGTLTDAEISSGGSVELQWNEDIYVNGTGSAKTLSSVTTVTLYQKLSLHGLLSSLTVQIATTSASKISSATISLVTAMSGGTILATSDITATIPISTSAKSFTWSGINTVIEGEVYLRISLVLTSAQNFHFRSSNTAPAAVTEYMYSGSTYLSYYLYVSYTIVGYSPLGVWVSPWISHGIASPYAGQLTVAHRTPSGTEVRWEVRHSADGGSTYGPWLAVSSLSQAIPGTLLSHIQFRATLMTTEHQTTPSVDSLWLLVSPLHRWTSPTLDVSSLMRNRIAIGLTGSLRVMGVEMRTGSGAWQSGVVLELDGASTAQARVTLLQTSSTQQTLDSLKVWEAITLTMLDKPQIEVRPPEVTDVICYVEDSDPLIEVTASLGVPADERVEVRVSVPAGSTQDYAQAYADAYLAVHGREQLSVTCKVPLATRISFGELVAVAIPYLGYTRDSPWLARVQRKTHRPLASPPHTELALGDFLPQDEEVLVRLLSRVEGG